MTRKHFLLALLGAPLAALGLRRRAPAATPVWVASSLKDGSLRWIKTPQGVLKPKPLYDYEAIAHAWREDGHTFYALKFHPQAFTLSVPRIGDPIKVKMPQRFYQPPQLPAEQLTTAKRDLNRMLDRWSRETFAVNGEYDKLFTL